MYLLWLTKSSLKTIICRSISAANHVFTPCFMPLLQRGQIKPDSFCYSAVLNTCQRAQQWKLVEVLSRHGYIHAAIQPNIVTFTTAVRAQQKWQLAICSNLCMLQLQLGDKAGITVFTNPGTHTHTDAPCREILELDWWHGRTIGGFKVEQDRPVECWTCTAKASLLKRWALVSWGYSIVSQLLSHVATPLDARPFVMLWRQVDLMWCSSVLKRCADAGQWRVVLSMLAGMRGISLALDECLGWQNFGWCGCRGVHSRCWACQWGTLPSNCCLCI